MNNYLEILELKPGASKEEVKKAYRRLSKVYHPDISKDENAKEKFIEINEAYEFLTKVGPSPNQESVNYDYNPETTEYERRRREARHKARKKAKEEAKLQEELTRKIITTFNYFAYAIVFFNLLLSVDVVLPRADHDQEIVDIGRVYQSNRGRYQSSGNQRIIFTNFEMVFKSGSIVNIKGYEKAIVSATPIFQKPMEVTISINGLESTYPQSFNIYRVFGIVIPFTLLMALLYFVNAKTLSSKLSYAVTLAFLILFQLYIFFSI